MPASCQIGDKFRKLLVIELYKRTPYANYYKCLCDCGKEVVLSAGKLNTRVGSCGCRSKPVKVDVVYKKLRVVWKSMLRRCYDTKHRNYARYGGCGITVSKEWHDWNTFYNDLKDLYIDGLQLDRKENSLGYSKGNCRFITRRENMRNRKDVKITTLDVIEIRKSDKTTIELGRIYNMDSSNISRIKNNKTWQF